MKQTRRKAGRLRAARGPVVWLDGAFVPRAEAKVSIFDHGLLYGDGVFEGIRAYDGLVFRLDEHLERLWNSAAAIGLEIPISRAEMADVICDVLRRNGLRDGYVRPVVTRGVGDLGLDPRKCPRPTVFVAADRLTLFPPAFYKEGMDAAIVRTPRNHPAAIPPHVKSLNYLNNILARIEVNRLGVGEGILLTHDGFVAEGTADNVFIVTAGRLRTPPVEIGALPGITRRCLLECAAAEGIPAVEEPFRAEDLRAADECLLTGTGAEVVPVVRVDGRPVGDGRVGPITRRLTAAFRAMTRTCGRRFL